MKLPNLYKWQQEALNKLRINNYKGIVVAVTGTGKSRIYCEVIRTLRCKTLIIVPTVALLQQTKNNLVEAGIKEDNIGMFYGEKKILKPLTIAVINSIYELRGLDKNFSLLVMDELHRYASNNWQRFLLNNKFTYQIGLTATLERSDGQEYFLIDRFGKVVYEYTTTQAIKDGLLNDFRIKNYGIDLPQKEREYLDRLDEKISLEMERFDKDLTKVINSVKRGNRYACKLLKMINQRKEFFNNSIPKVNKAVTIIKEYLQPKQTSLRSYSNTISNIINISLYSVYNKYIIYNNSVANYMDANYQDAVYRDAIYRDAGNKIIVFGEYIKTADLLHTKLQEAGINAWVYYTGTKTSKFKLSAKDKREVIEAFKNCKSGILITVKALDEGLDVKDANIGILLGYNKTNRQAIQRMGRILRKAEKKSPTMINLFYTNTKDYYNAKNFSDQFQEGGKIEWL